MGVITEVTVRLWMIFAPMAISLLLRLVVGRSKSTPRSRLQEILFSPALPLFFIVLLIARHGSRVVEMELLSLLIIMFGLSSPWVLIIWLELRERSKKREE